MPYSKIKFYVGLFSILFLIGLSFVFVMLMEKKGLFDEYNRFFFKSKDAQIFYIGMPIKLSGFEIGNIEDMRLLDSAKVKITVKIKSLYRDWITKDTKLIINRPLIGTPTIDVITKSKLHPLEENEEIEDVIIEDDIDDIIAKLQPIVSKLQNIVDNIEVATNKFAKEGSPINRSIKNIEIFTKKLASDKPFLTLMTEDKNSTDALISALNESKDIMRNLNLTIKEANATVSDTRKGVIPAVASSAKDLQKIMRDVRRKLSKLDGVVRELSSSKKDIKRLKRDIRVNMHKTNRVIRKIDRTIGKTPKSRIELP